MVGGELGVRLKRRCCDTSYRYLPRLPPPHDAGAWRSCLKQERSRNIALRIVFHAQLLIRLKQFTNM
jgi:hypothetical protein